MREYFNHFFTINKFPTTVKISGGRRPKKAERETQKKRENDLILEHLRTIEVAIDDMKKSLTEDLKSTGFLDSKLKLYNEYFGSLLDFLSKKFKNTLTDYGKEVVKKLIEFHSDSLIDIYAKAVNQLKKSILENEISYKGHLRPKMDDLIKRMDETYNGLLKIYNLPVPRKKKNKNRLIMDRGEHKKKIENLEELIEDSKKLSQKLDPDIAFENEFKKKIIENLRKSGEIKVEYIIDLINEKNKWEKDYNSQTRPMDTLKQSLESLRHKAVTLQTSGSLQDSKGKIIEYNDRQKRHFLRLLNHEITQTTLKMDNLERKLNWMERILYDLDFRLGTLQNNLSIEELTKIGEKLKKGQSLSTEELVNCATSPSFLTTGYRGDICKVRGIPLDNLEHRRIVKNEDLARAMAVLALGRPDIIFEAASGQITNSGNESAKRMNWRNQLLDMLDGKAPLGMGDIDVIKRFKINYPELAKSDEKIDGKLIYRTFISELQGELKKITKNVFMKLYGEELDNYRCGPYKQKPVLVNTIVSIGSRTTGGSYHPSKSFVDVPKILKTHVYELLDREKNEEDKLTESEREELANIIDEGVSQIKLVNLSQNTIRPVSDYDFIVTNNWVLTNYFNSVFSDLLNPKNALKLGNPILYMSDIFLGKKDPRGLPVAESPIHVLMSGLRLKLDKWADILNAGKIEISLMRNQDAIRYRPDENIPFFHTENFVMPRNQ